MVHSTYVRASHPLKHLFSAANLVSSGGPTWPVPDVTNVLEDAIARDAKTLGKKADPRKEIEKLKDQLRYVLEVY